MMNGHNKGDHYRRYRIDERLILTVLGQWRHQQFVRLPQPISLPPDYEIHGVDHDLRYLGFTLLIWHPSFPIVPAGTAVPLADVDLQWESVMVGPCGREDCGRFDLPPAAARLEPAVEAPAVEPLADAWEAAVLGELRQSCGKVLFTAPVYRRLRSQGVPRYAADAAINRLCRRREVVARIVGLKRTLIVEASGCRRMAAI